ncbi:MAG TPA: class I SAM-dependent methyltransferase [Desulfuromonadales bacterium]|nr:class I SAM-dependent methyltransferase [Desulfuromonadales bacterium]
MTEKRNFDLAALVWDEEPRRVQLAMDIVLAIKSSVPLSTEWDGLDIGCGTGLVTLQLAPFLRNITGLDSSCGMLDKLAEKVKISGIKNVRSVLRDLAAGEMPEGKYHLITSAMTLHHITEIEPLLSSLRAFLSHGGWIALADLATEDGSFHDDPSGVFHHGFSATELTAMLENCGYSHVSVTTAAIIGKNEKAYPVLLATAQAF